MNATTMNTKATINHNDDDDNSITCNIDADTASSVAKLFLLKSLEAVENNNTIAEDHFKIIMIDIISNTRDA
jgi:hypothetical protein